MLKMKALPIAAAVAAVMASTAVSAAVTNPDFFGYFRSGFGTTDDGQQTKFKVNNLGRMGNEGDTYIEVGLGKEIYNEGGKSVYVTTMWNMWDGSGHADGSENNGVDTGWEQLNMEMRNFLGKGETFWAGQKQWNRHYNGQNDLFYWGSTTVGAGVGDYSVGNGVINAAVLSPDANASEYAAASTGSATTALETTVLDLGWDKVQVWDGGQMFFDYKFVNAHGSNAQEDYYDTEYGTELTDGHAFNIELVQAFSLGTNTTSIQYYLDGSALQGVNNGGANGLDVGVESGDGFRFLNYGHIAMNQDWDFDHTFIYASADVDMADGKSVERDLTSISAMVTYHWNDITRTYVEGGYMTENETINSGDEENFEAYKATIAQAWSSGRGQPELRVYATYIDATDDPIAAGRGTDETAFGVQANVWW